MRDLRSQTIRRDADELLRHLQEFGVEPKFSAGVWFFAPGGGRFHENYVESMSIEQILEIAAGLAKYGLKGLEAHYPKEVNEDNIHLYKQLEDDTGIKLTMIGPMPFAEAEWQFAARERGRKIRFGNGQDIARSSEMNFNAAEDQSAFAEKGEFRKKTTPVGSFRPNSLGCTI